MKTPFLSELRGEDDLSWRALRYLEVCPILRVFDGRRGDGREQRRSAMTKNQSMAGTTLLVVTLVASFFFAGNAQAQGVSPAYLGKFTLTQQIHWGKVVLQPGNYTITIESMGSPVIAKIRTADGNAVTDVMTADRTGNTNAVSALLIKEKNGQMNVFSLALADLGTVLIYDPGLAREAVQEAHSSQTVPVMLAKK
jgi:hypothetical protein